MPISEADLALLRSPDQYVAAHINVVPPVVVATAQVNQTTFTYPLAQVTVDNTANWSNIKVGQMVWIGTTPGAYDVTMGIVRKAPTATILYIDAKSSGDPGRAKSVALALADNQYVTIIRYWPMWGLFSRISERIFYKQWDLAYTDQGSSPDPVCNIGAWRQAFVSTVTNTASFAFSASGSFAWGSKTISSYSWNVDGGTVTGGSLTSSAVTAEFTPGFYVVSCTITDSGGKTHTAYTYVWANTRTGANAPLSSQYAVSINSDRQDRQGRSMSITINGSVPESTVFPGTAFLYTEEGIYNGSTLSAGTITDTFAGFVSDERRSSTRNVTSLSVDLKSPFGMLGDVPTVSQAIIESTSAVNWTQITSGSGLSNINGAVWYVLYYHVPNFIATFDVNKLNDVTAIRKKRWALNGNTIAEQLQEIAALVTANVGSASDGSLWLRRDPSLENSTFRDALDIRLTWTEADLKDSVEFPFSFRPKVGQQTAYAFMFTGGEPIPLGSLAPGTAQGQAAGRPTHESLIVTDQSDLNARTGHLLAKANNPTPEITLRVLRNFDVADPAKMLWHVVTIGATYDPRGLGFSSRVLPVSVDRSWQQAANGIAMVKSVTITAEPETFGQPGITVPVNRGGGTIYPPETDPFETVDDFTSYLEDFALVWDSNSNLARTFNLLEGDAANWQNVKGTITGSMSECCVDWWSPLPSSGWVEGSFGVFAVACTGTSLRIYYCSDILADFPVWTLRHTYTMADGSVDLSARIQASVSTQGFVAVAWKARTGTFVGRSTDGGATWGTAVQVGATVAETLTDDFDLGFAVEGSTVLVCAPSAAGQYKAYKATTTGGAFSEVANPQTATALMRSLTVDGEGRAYIPVEGGGGGGGTTSTVTFGAGGYANYTISGGPSLANVNLERANGFANGSPNVSSQQPNIAVLIDLVTPTTVTQVAWTAQRNEINVSSNTGTNYEVFVELLNASSVVVYTSASNVYSGAYSEQPNNGSETMNVANVRYVRVTNRYVAAASATGFGGNASLSVHLDNLAVTYGGAAGDKFYVVSSYTGGSPGWTDITPTGAIPKAPYAFALNPAASAESTLLGTASGVIDLYLTANRGTSWTDDGTVLYTGHVRSVETALFFGPNLLDYSEDLGATVLDVRGDYATSIGTPGTFRGAIVVL